MAHLTRQDGILLFLTLVIVILVSPLGWKRRLAYASIASCVYILILIPLMLSNFKTFGLPLPPDPSKSMFITHYEDLYSYSKEINLDNYLDWGVKNIIQSKIYGLIGDAKIIYDRLLGTFLKVFVVVGGLLIILASKKDKRLDKYLPALIFISFLYIFYSLVVPISSGGAGFTRSSMSLLPILVIIAIDTINTTIPNKAVVVVIILAILISSWNKSIWFTRDQLEENATLGEEMERLNQVITDVTEEEQEEIVIMTRIPWQVYLTTKHRAIQIPNDDLDTIYKVARRFSELHFTSSSLRSA